MFPELKIIKKLSDGLLEDFEVVMEVEEQVKRRREFLLPKKTSKQI